MTAGSNNLLPIKSPCDLSSHVPLNGFFFLDFLEIHLPVPAATNIIEQIYMFLAYLFYFFNKHAVGLYRY